MLQDGLLTDFYPPVGLIIGVACLVNLCPSIHPGVDFFLGILPLY